MEWAVKDSQCWKGRFAKDRIIQEGNLSSCVLANIDA